MSAIVNVLEWGLLIIIIIIFIILFIGGSWASVGGVGPFLFWILTIIPTTLIKMNIIET